MATVIERLLARMAAYRDGLEVGLGREADAEAGAPSFVGIDGDLSAAALMAAAAADNATKAAARLRSLHEFSPQQEAARSPAGFAPSPTVIDTEFIEVVAEKAP